MELHTHREVHYEMIISTRTRVGVRRLPGRTAEIATVFSFLVNDGEDIRIFTARVNPKHGCADVVRERRAVEAWCELHLGQILPVTPEKDWDMLLFDDRARQVEHNTGRVVGDQSPEDLDAHRSAISRG